MSITALRAMILVLVTLTGCTTVGVHDLSRLAQTPMGLPVEVRLCVYLDSGISAAQAHELLDAAWRDEEARLGLRWRIVEVRPWHRAAFTVWGLKEAAVHLPLTSHCDRLMVFVGRHAGDVLYGLLSMAIPLPEVLGWADDVTRTHGYVVASRVSALQLGMPPASTLRHELYHMLGCEHDITLGPCYQRIAELKAAQREDFFPAINPEGGIVLATRQAVTERRAYSVTASSIREKIGSAQMSHP